MSTAETLLSSRAFKGLDPAHAVTCAPLWSPRAVPEGETIWLHGETSEAIAVVASGELAIEVANERINTVGAHEVVGEASAWFGQPRTASVRALRDTRLLVLPARSLATLRADHTPVYDRLLDHALRESARKVNATTRELARKAAGQQPAPRPSSPNPLKRLLTKLSGARGGTPAPVQPALRKLPTLEQADGAVLLQIGRAMTPHHLSPGEPLFLEADEGDSLFLVADGCIDVLRNVRGGRAELLTSLFPGALVGTNAVLLRERRSASCVAASTTACWVYELTASQLRGLGGEPGRVLKEALMAALRSQLLRTSEGLAAHNRGGRRVERSDYDRALAELSAYRAEGRTPQRFNSTWLRG